MNKEIFKEIKELINVALTLMGPNGCPWDREQTLVSMRSSVLEEACEVIEAIDDENDPALIEELGDLLYNVIFFCILGEKEGKFMGSDVISGIKNKLIRRHPHVFGSLKLEGHEDLLEQWEALKREEKQERESLLDGIPKGLPALSKGYKMASKMAKAQGHLEAKNAFSFENEEELGNLLWDLVIAAKEKDIQPEHALRKHLLSEEKNFREWEKRKA